MSIRISTALLCDAATVREGLLHVLGGGITVLGRTAFPARMRVDLGLIITAPSEYAAATHRVVITIARTGPDGDESIALEGQLAAVELDPESDDPWAMAAVVNLHEIPLAGPGRYRLTISVDDEDTDVELFFRAVEATPSDDDAAGARDATA